MPDNNGMTKLRTSDISKSRGLFLKFLGKQVGNSEEGKVCHGDYAIKETIIRFKDGYFHGGADTEGNPQPAIECGDGHTEWWEDGYLHRENGPAIISDYGDWEEYWEHGKLVMILYREPVSGKGIGQ
jgi:hypothetical protein